ncbi:MAG: hypothetical protein PUD16_12775 [bacterium]|nr:hypothetical protein [bacterium]
MDKMIHSCLKHTQDVKHGKKEAQNYKRRLTNVCTWYMMAIVQEGSVVQTIAFNLFAVQIAAQTA